MTWKRKAPGLAAVLIAVSLAWQLTTSAQQPPPGRPQLAVTPSRFEFEVIESFDSKYLGDTPGHAGKNGGLGDIRPNVALGDPVFQNKTRVGTVTGLIWDRSKGALTVEFDPEPLQRITVGEVVWIALDGSATPKATRR